MTFSHMIFLNQFRNPFISPCRSCKNGGPENDLLRGPPLGNSRARNPNSGWANAQPRSGSGLGVKVCSGFRALSLFWALGSLLPPAMHASAGLAASGLRRWGVSSSFPPRCEDSQLFVPEPRTAYQGFRLILLPKQGRGLALWKPSIRGHEFSRHP